MVIGWLLVAALQAPACGPGAAAAMAAAGARGAVFDLRGAAAAYAEVPCDQAQIAAHYLRGLVAARDARAAGGAPESLAPVAAAVAALDRLAAPSRPWAQIASAVLQAAAAAAQSEREVMAVALAHALALEAVQLEAGEPGLPVVTAHEAAGDLWLQVHRYEEARQAYVQAELRLGATARTGLGLARAAARLDQPATACAHYRALVRAWREPADPEEIAEARAYLAQPPCRP